MVGERHVFVVDDDDAVRDSLAVLLESAGYRVEAFSAAADFLQSDAPRRPGCLIVDVRMPGMDGLALQRHLNAQASPLALIVMTGHADVALAVQVMKAGAVDFVEKPFDSDALLASLDDAMARVAHARRPAPEAAAFAARLALLTPREHEVLDGLVAGDPNKVIAFNLKISPRTVEIHRARVMEKTQASSLSHLVRMVLEADGA
ncbi:MAG: response regulator FixJ [Azospirillaceae bacterium]|nr:response regulator FixJ [Azospirillaceae bacterium]